MSQIKFLHPEMFFLMLGLLPMIGWYIWKHKTIQASLQISSLKGFAANSGQWMELVRHLPFVLRMILFALIITILARPQSSNQLQNRITEGIDIVMTLDISGSMLAQDFKPNRLEAAKDVAVQFINGRRDDKIGLVIFAAESFTQCPITTDHTVLTNLFMDIRTGMLEDGTAIGMGLATAVARLKSSEAKSKVIILLTDGENNRGDIAPMTAAELAKTFGIRVYTIGVGTIGKAPYPVQTAFGLQYQEVDVKIDEPLLKEMAQLTGGEYFRATDKEKLQQIYAKIDELEKTKVEVQEYTKRQEEYQIFALMAIACLLAEIVLRNTLLRNLP
ncbi:Ca-activated chloride channel family protein [Breznakibacter xylanolyticus]|uniref:Ca-activated chloride channel family protein n=1 Tax=Breznakibacter xylanolyticus TaxID=990 RepID=A0A2W7N3Z4_9BACT|nr:VWA domain-containing protein [Breznakibacter xylanolyticus]MBN2743227.1 VWA domain-containing protein [Marinilabiliaceae bacterium]PZX14413.1 Ca-activated chloride channel family protein [Breznakibacter xylanolyticus]